MGKSVIGFHYSLGGNRHGITQFMEKLNGAGIPFLVKGTDDAGLCHEAHDIGKRFGVANHLIYRVSSAGQNNGIEYDVPDYTKSPRAAAEEHFRTTRAKFDQANVEKTTVWMEPINEPRAKKSADDIQYQDMEATDWLGAFMFEYAKIANAQGYKVCGPSFNSGEPEVFTRNDYALPGMVDYLRYCAEHPSQAALSVHEYIWDRWKTESWDNWYPALWGRVEAAMAAADANNIPRTFSIFMTEWGFAHYEAPRWDQAERHLTAYNEWAARWPQVKGVAAWTFQMGWGTVDNDLQSWLAPLADYAVSREFSPGAQPATPHASFANAKTSSTTTGPVQTGDNDAAEAAGFGSSIDLSTVNLTPGNTFLATWTFKNSGDSTWDGRYQLVYSRTAHPEVASYPCSPLGLASSYAITDIGAPESVAPGEWVSLTITLTAPPAAGRFGTNWQLQGPNGAVFGPIRWAYGTVSSDSTPQPPPPAGTYDGVFVDFSHSVGDAYTNMTPGQSFSSTWTLRNTGTRAWGGDVKAMYVPQPKAELTGHTLSLLGGKSSYTLQELSGKDRVNPGETVTVTFNFVAPDQPGKYGYQWQLIPPDAIGFGGVRWTEIWVAGGTTTTPVDDGRDDTPAPTGQRIDLLPYLRGDGRSYMVRSQQSGNQELIFSQTDGNRFYTCKGEFWWNGKLVCNWEEMWVAGEYIMRGTDTSPDADRYYTQRENGRYGSRWIKQHMVIGESVDSNPQVQFYRKNNCAKVSQNSGDAHNTLILVAHHQRYTFPNGTTVEDVIELKWIPGNETYFYMRNVGLVGWQGLHDGHTPTFNVVSEWLPRGKQLPQRMTIPCLDRN